MAEFFPVLEVELAHAEIHGTHAKDEPAEADELILGALGVKGEAEDVLLQEIAGHAGIWVCGVVYFFGDRIKPGGEFLAGFEDVIVQVTGVKPLQRG